MVNFCLDHHARGDLDLALLSLVAGHTVSPAGSFMATAIGASGLPAHGDIIDAELEAGGLGLDMGHVALTTLLGETLAFLLGGLFLLKALGVSLENFFAFLWPSFAVTLVGDEVWVRNTHVGSLEHRLLVCTLANGFDFRWVLCDAAYGLIRVGYLLRNHAVQASWGSREYATSIRTGEVAGLRNGVEDLCIGKAVGGEVVN